MTVDEVKDINCRKQSQTQINQGIISDNEIKCIRTGRGIEDILSKALHRIYNIPIKESGNDFDAYPSAIR